MKYTILGFSQARLVEFNLDAVDALLLRYFIDFKDSGSMTLEIFNNKPYYWVNYSTLIKELPIINIKSNDVLRRRFKKLEDCKVLEYYLKKEGGSYSFYAVGENYKLLISNCGEIPNGSYSKVGQGPTQKSEGSYLKVGGGPTQKSEQKINLLKDSSIKDNSNNNKGLNPIGVYQANIFHSPGKLEIDAINSWCETLGEEVVILAINIAAKNNARRLEYIEKILMDWDTRGIKTVEQAEAYTKQRSEKFKKGASSSQAKGNFNNKKESTFNNFKQREYNYDDLKKKLLGWDKKE